MVSVNRILPIKVGAERQWEKDIQALGWAIAENKPRELGEWVKRANDKLLPYRVIEVEGTPIAAWDPSSFNPRLGYHRDFQFLIEFSEGKPKGRVVDKVAEHFHLPSQALSEAVVEYLSLEAGVLVDLGNGMIGLSDTFLPSVAGPEDFLETMQGLATIDYARERLQYDANEVLSKFKDSPPKRLVGNGVILDLQLRNIAMITSNLLASDGSLVRMSRMADELGLTQLGLEPADVEAMTKRACDALPALHPEFEIEVQDDGWLHIGGADKVVAAHLKLRQTWLEGWQERVTFLEDEMETKGKEMDDLGDEVEMNEAELERKRRAMVRKAIQSAFLTRFVDRLNSPKKD